MNNFTTSGNATGLGLDLIITMMIGRALSLFMMQPFTVLFPVADQESKR